MSANEERAQLLLEDETVTCYCDGFRHCHNPGPYSWQCPDTPVSGGDRE